MSITSSELRDVLSLYRFRFQSEAELQDGIALALERAGVTFQREARLGGPTERIDFLFEGGLGLEVKIDGSDTDLTRQLARYASRPEIRELLVVSSRQALANLPKTLSGKPIHVHALPPELA